MTDEEKKAKEVADKAAKEAEALEAKRLKDETEANDKRAKEAAQVETKKAEAALAAAKEAEAKAAEVTKEVMSLKGKTVRSKGKPLTDMNGVVYSNEGAEVTKPTHWIYDQIQAGKAEVVEE